MTASPAILFSFLLVLAFSFSTWLEPRARAWTGHNGGERLMQVLLGDGRQMLANQMFVEADVYFHAGYYPSIFDQQHAPTNSDHMTRADTHEGDAHGSGAHNEQEAEEAHEKAMKFLDEPRDWIERFGRKFAITTHTHLAGGTEREMLPWLRLSADLDPQRIQTYTVAGYWLRRKLNKPKEAEEFLREGLRANPDSYEILLELGSLYYESYHDSTRARNLWEAAVQRWEQREEQKKEPDLTSYDQLTVRLAHLEEEQGNYAKAIHWLQLAMVKKASPDPEALQAQVDALRAKLK